MLTILQTFNWILDVINKAIKTGKELKKMFFKSKEKPAESGITFAPVIVVYDKETAKELLSDAVDKFSLLITQVSKTEQGNEKAAE